jgi:hypothetical protein
MKVQEYKFDLFADYFQFYLQDEKADADLSQCWTEQAVNDLIAVDSGVIGVGTVRNMTVSVAVEICDIEPKEDESKWQHITECSISIPSGSLVIMGCSDYFPDAPRIRIKPDTYQAKVYYGGLDSVSEDGLDGDDFYKVVLWNGESTEPKVIKRRK